MIIFVGSTNPVKVNAIKLAIAEKWPTGQIIGIETASGVAAQPLTDEETRTGAGNRARAALATGLKTLTNAQITTADDILGVGLEGGVFGEKSTDFWSTVWVTVADREGKIFESNGARFKLPPSVATQILAGAEMGHAMGEMFTDPQLKQKQGAIGILTNNFTDRTKVYTSIAKLALGLWYGQDWQNQIPQA